MFIHKPRVGQWVIYGDECKVGKVQKVRRKFLRKKWLFTAFTVKRVTVTYGPVETVQVDDVWYPVEKTKIIGPKEAKLQTGNLY